MENTHKIYVSTTFAKDNSKLSDVIKLCIDNDITHLELGSNHCYEKDYNYLNDYNIRYLVHNYFPIPEKSFVVNIASLDEDVRKKSLDHIYNALNLCETINSNLYTFHPVFLTDPKGSNINSDNYDFQWEEKKLDNSNYQKALDLMYKSLEKIIPYAQNKKINIAIESEGSLTKNQHLLMQKPSEFEFFIKKYKKSEIGINLNIGHLNLASKAFGFSRKSFVELIKNNIYAIELSHNNGYEDDHMPLENNNWYWEIIKDLAFKEVYKILEFRNTSINNIKENIKMIQELPIEI